MHASVNAAMVTAMSSFHVPAITVVPCVTVCTFIPVVTTDGTGKSKYGRY